MDLIKKIDDLLIKYSNAGISSSSGLSSQLGGTSSAVLLTGGVESKKKKIKKSDSAGIITTINGKKLKMTGLTEKEKDEYLFGDTKIEKAINYIDMVSEYVEAHQSPNLEDDDGSLEKCDMPASKLIKGKMGVWRRISGRPCFICKDGTIHAGPKAFVGRKAATLRDDLRAEKKKSTKSGK